MDRICFTEIATRLLLSKKPGSQNLYVTGQHANSIQTINKPSVRTKAKLIFCIVFQCLFMGKAFSQEVARQKFITVESGIDFIVGELIKDDYIRGDVPSYYNMGESTKNLSVLFYKKYIGLKTEVFSANNKFGFSGGLRFTRMDGSVGKNTYWTGTSDWEKTWLTSG